MITQNEVDFMVAQINAEPVRHCDAFADIDDICQELRDKYKLPIDNFEIIDDPRMIRGSIRDMSPTILRILADKIEKYDVERQTLNGLNWVKYESQINEAILNKLKQTIQYCETGTKYEQVSNACMELAYELWTSYNNPHHLQYISELHDKYDEYLGVAKKILDMSKD